MSSFFPVHTPQEAAFLLNLPQEELFARAEALREAAFGRKVTLCAIINARSGNCSMDCRFCSQSGHNRTNIKTFALLSDAELRARILHLATLPVARIGIVTSGATLNTDEQERLRTLVAGLSQNVRSRICASLGRLTADSLRQVRASGLTRYHHNLESSRGFYPSVCTTQTWGQRKKTVESAQQAGLEVCCGGLFGLGETWAHRIDFAFALKQMGITQVPLNFLYPHPETPLADMPPLDAGEALRIIAVFRHILPHATLRVCGGRPLVLGRRQQEIFRAGANALMTGDYLTTQGQSLAHDLEMIASLGLEAGNDFPV